MEIIGKIPRYCLFGEPSTISQDICVTSKTLEAVPNAVSSAEHISCMRGDYLLQEGLRSE